jgi:hypothetical protein
MKITSYQGDPSRITIINDVKRSCALSEEEQRELLMWFKVNKPTMIGEVICEDCREILDNRSYGDNKSERCK